MIFEAIFNIRPNNGIATHSLDTFSQCVLSVQGLYNDPIFIII